MQLDPQGGRIFTVQAPGVSVVEVTVDFGGGFIRTLGMHRSGDEWSIRLHPGLPCHRFRFRVDGRVVAPEGGTDVAAWREVRPAA